MLDRTCGRRYARGRPYSRGRGRDGINYRTTPCLQILQLGGEGHRAKDCPLSNTVTNSESIVLCFNCGEMAHVTGKRPHELTTQEHNKRGRVVYRSWANERFMRDGTKIAIDHEFESAL